MKILAINKRASFDYEILETYEAGLVLSGSEVKSIRQGQASLKGSYVSLKVNSQGRVEAFLLQAHIPPYKAAGLQPEYNSERPRKLLLKKKELSYLIGKKEEKGLTVIPIKLYTKRSFIKLEIALVRGKKFFDKREDLKKKDLDRQLRTLTKEKLRT